MIKIIIYVLSLAVFVTIAVWFAETPGAVTIEWLGWRIDTSVAILFALMAAILVIGTVLIRLWSALVGMGRSYRDARKDKKTRKGLDALAIGFAGVQGGDSTAAYKGARDAKASLGDHAAIRLLEQKATRLSGDTTQAGAAARELLTDPATEMAALHDLSTAAQDIGDLEGALGYAKRALGLKTPPRWALDMTLDLQIALSHWEDAISTLERKDVIPLFKAVDQQRLKSTLYAYAAVAAGHAQNAEAAIKWARKSLSLDATRVDAAVALAQGLIATNKSKKAGAEIEKAWRTSPHPDLLNVYLQLSPADSELAKTKQIETLVSGNADHPQSRLAMAEAALRAELWGQARSRLEPLLDEDTTPAIRGRAAALKAQVDLGEHGDTKAATNALLIALESRPAPVEMPVPSSAADLLSRAN